VGEGELVEPERGGGVGGAVFTEEGGHGGGRARGLRDGEVSHGVQIRRRSEKCRHE
jgi:hypothetical protein